MTRQLHSNSFEEVVELLLENGFDSFADALSILLNEAMKIERSKVLKASPYERNENRTGYANGFKPKRVRTRVGEIQLEVPQVRGGIDYYPSCLEKGTRSERALTTAIAEMYFNGVSTRKVRKIFEELCGSEISSQEVSRATEKLDSEFENWRKRSLEQTSYIILDARYEKVRIDGIVRDAAILFAIGVRESDRRRSVLGVSVSLSEAEVHWRKFLEELNLRGLKGIKMITSDDHAGLRAALKTVWTSVPWQRCQFHLQQNAGHYLPKKEMHKEVAQEIRAVFNSPNQKEAEEKIRQLVKNHEKNAPKFSRWAEENLLEGLTVFSQPEQARRKLRTSNSAERLSQELKRRTRVVRVFPSVESLLRLATAVLIDKSDEWETGRVYL